MSDHQDTDTGRPLDPTKRPKPLRLVRLLLAVAILGAGYLAWVSFSNGPVAGCGPQSGCNKVLQSRWAYWLNIPVSLPALLVYLGLLTATLDADKRSDAAGQRRAWGAIIVLSVTVAGAAAWFIGLQAFLIRAFCKFCMTAHLCGLAAAFLALKSAPRRSNRPEGFCLSLGSFARLAFVGLVGVAVLMAGQVMVKKKRYLVMPVSGFKGARLLSIHEGQFWLKLDELPMLGSPDAPKVIVSLFDYTCPHCRELHPMLAQAQRRFSNRLAIVALPVPLATNCNPSLTRYYPAHTQACDYAQLGLAVWRAKAEAFQEFDDWLFEPFQVAPLEQARQQAARLVGTQKLEQALSDEWITRQIHTNGRLYQANFLKTGRAHLPELMIGPVMTFGPLDDVNDLYKILEQHLGLK